MITKNTDNASLVGIIITLLIAAATFYGQYTNPETGMLVFGLLLLFIFLFYLISWPISYLKEKLILIDSNKCAIIRTNKDLSILKDRLNMNIRITKLEVENEIKKKK
jgi:hypothetical protein